MKKQILVLALLCVSTFLMAQDFMGKGVFVNGLKIEREVKWKEKLRVIFKENVAYVTKDKVGRDMAQIGVMRFNSSGKPVSYDFTNNTMCDGTNYELDLRALCELDGQLPMFVFEGYNYRYEGDPILIPLKYTEGEKLPDVARKVWYKMSDAKEFPADFSLTNRKVEGKETITTPAGSFDCIKYSWVLSASMPNTVSLDSSKNTTVWISDGLVVKTEQKNAKGKVFYNSQITKLEKK